MLEWQTQYILIVWSCLTWNCHAIYSKNYYNQTQVWVFDYDADGGCSRPLKRAVAFYCRTFFVSAHVSRLIVMRCAHLTHYLMILLVKELFKTQLADCHVMTNWLWCLVVSSCTPWAAPYRYSRVPHELPPKSSRKAWSVDSLGVRVFYGFHGDTIHSIGDPC